MSYRFIGVFAVAAIWSQPALAQFAPDGASVAPPKAVGPIMSATGTSDSAIPQTALSALTSSGDSTVSLTISPKTNGLLRGDGQQAVSLTLNAPLNDAGTEGSFITEQGIPNKWSAELSYTFVFGNFSDPALFEREYVQNCTKQANKDIMRLGLIGEGSTAYRKNLCHFGTPVSSLTEEDLRRFLTPEKAATVHAHRALRDSPIKILNLSASIGYKKFSYLKPSDFSEHSDKTVPFSLSVAYGINPNAEAPFYGFGYTYKRDYKAADDRIFCPLPGGPAPIECKSDKFDPPKRNIDHSVFGLVRTTNLFGIPAALSRKTKAQDKDDTDVAPSQFMPIVEIKATYDIQDKIFGVSVPVYIFLDKDKQFKGGFRTEWQQGTGTEKDRVKFSFFVVKSFDFFGL
jgi:hypothetical protein